MRWIEQAERAQNVERARTELPQVMSRCRVSCKWRLTRPLTPFASALHRGLNVGCSNCAAVATKRVPAGVIRSRATNNIEFKSSSFLCRTFRLRSAARSRLASRITRNDRSLQHPGCGTFIGAIHRGWGEAQGNYEEFRLFSGLRPCEQLALVVRDSDAADGVLSATRSRVAGIDRGRNNNGERRRVKLCRAHSKRRAARRSSQ